MHIIIFNWEAQLDLLTSVGLNSLIQLLIVMRNTGNSDIATSFKHYTKGGEGE